MMGKRAWISGIESNDTNVFISFLYTILKARGEKKIEFLEKKISN